MKNIKNIPNHHLLKFNHAGVLKLKDGSSSNHGVIKLTDNELIYYTGKGIREIFKPYPTEEAKEKSIKLHRLKDSENGISELIKTEHIAVLKLSDILSIES